MYIETFSLLYNRVFAKMWGWEGVMPIIILTIIIIIMILVADHHPNHNRVLAEMEGWEGIGQEELAALRHQV